MKAQQEPEVAVLERPQPSNQQYLANKPPPGPGYRPSRDEVGSQVWLNGSILSISKLCHKET